MTRNFLPGCPFLLPVKAGRASAIRSSVRIVRERDAALSYTAGERLSIKIQLRDEHGNSAVLDMFPQAQDHPQLTATVDTPNEQLALTLKAAVAEERTDHPRREASKKASVASSIALIGAYELVCPTELTTKGDHVVSILLDGSPITDSPVHFIVRHAVATAAKSWLQAPSNPPVINETCQIVLHLVDKYGNVVERGEVRVDAKVFGSKASDAQVVDVADGTYTISFTASLSGDYKVQVRLENNELPALAIHVADDEHSELHLMPSRRPDDLAASATLTTSAGLMVPTEGGREWKQLVEITSSGHPSPPKTHQRNNGAVKGKAKAKNAGKHSRGGGITRKGTAPAGRQRSEA